MALSVRIITGPPSSRVTKEAAAKKLEEAPEFPKGAAYELEEVEGRWVAAIATETIEKESDFPPSAESAPSPDGPAGDDGPAPDDGASADDSGGEDKPEGEDKPPKDHDKGEGGELGEIKHLLTTLLTALGLDPAGAEGSPVPGLDEGPPAPPHPAGPPGPGSDEKTHTVHERALKPGEAPPGSTPVGAPAFASLREDHPWRDVVGKKRSFIVEEPVGKDEPLSAIASELKDLASETGKYRVAQLVERKAENGQRFASALISV